MSDPVLPWAIPDIGHLDWKRAVDHPELVAEVTYAALLDWVAAQPEVANKVFVAEVDPDSSDTAAMCHTYDIPMTQPVNCVLVAGRREGVERTAAAAVRASTRVDISGTVTQLLDVRKASFVPVDRAVMESGMEYGGITPIGLSKAWPILLDDGAKAGWIVIGSGVRRSKIALPGVLLATMPRVTVSSNLGIT